MLRKKAVVTFLLALSGITVIAALAIGLSGGSITSLLANDRQDIGASKAPVVMNEHIKALNSAFVEVSNAVLPTVVSISVEIDIKNVHKGMGDQWDEFYKFFGVPPFNGGGGDDEEYKSKGSGSGVILSNDGYIVTNNHVVENVKADEIKVTTYDKKIHKAKLVGRDPLTDLAVIKIDATDLQSAYFANIDDIQIGEMVVAVGNPLGLNSTVTSGIISAKGRGQLGLTTQHAKSGYAVENFLQTDAAINPGNSGGGLFDLSGALVGINTAIATSTGTYIGYGFAIPIDIVKAVVLDLINHGKITRGYIGVQIQTVDEVLAKSVGLDNVEGVLVRDVLKDSPAEKAGIETTDVILEIDGKKVGSSNELQSMVVSHKPGDRIQLTIWRDKKKINKEVKLEAKKDDKEVADANVQSNEQSEATPAETTIDFDKLGFTVKPIDKQVKDDLEVDHGAFISGVKRYGPAADRGLAPNGVIVKADRQNIKSPEQLKKLIGEKKSGDAVMLQIKYKGSNQIIALEIP